MNELKHGFKQLKKDILVLTHNDLDALGCLLNIQYALPKDNLDIYSTNYRNINEKCYEVEQRISDCKLLIICDVSFSQYKDKLLQLISSCKRESKKLLYIDHHEYPDNFFDDLNHITYVHDKTKSATMLTHNFFKNNQKCKALDNFTTLTDIYDIWRSRHKHFQTAIDLNSYFWLNDLIYLFNKIKENNYKLPNDYKKVIENYNFNAKINIKKFHENKLIFDSRDIRIAFIDDYIPEVIAEGFKKNLKSCIVASSYGIVRVRFNEFSDITKQQKQKIKSQILTSKDIGHLNAFALKVEKSGFDSIMKEIKKISSIISEEIRD